MGKLKFVSEHARHVSIAMMAIAALMVIDGVYQTAMHVKWRHWLPAALAANAATTQPASSQPASSQPTDSQPAGSQPASSQSANSQPAASQPAATRPSGSQPAGTRPAGSQPTTTRPAPPQVTAKTAGQSPPEPSEPPAVSAAIRKRSLFAPPQPKTPRPSLTGVLGSIALFKTADGRTVGIAEGESSQGLKVKRIRDYEVVVEYEGKTDTMKLFSGTGSSGPQAPSPEMESSRRSRQ